MDKIFYTAKTALREEPVRFSGTLPDGCNALMTEDGRAFPAQNIENGVTAIVTCAADEALTLTPGISDFPKMHLATGRIVWRSSGAGRSSAGITGIMRSGSRISDRSATMRGTRSPGSIFRRRSIRTTVPSILRSVT